jgi:hypothetical protein
MRKFVGPMGSVSRLSVDSQALRSSNMLGDPSVRVVDVYLPAGHDGQVLPLLVDLAGFTGSGRPVAGLMTTPKSLRTCI